MVRKGAHTSIRTILINAYLNSKIKGTAEKQNVESMDIRTHVGPDSNASIPIIFMGLHVLGIETHAGEKGYDLTTRPRGPVLAARKEGTGSVLHARRPTS